MAESKHTLPWRVQHDYLSDILSVRGSDKELIYITPSPEPKDKANAAAIVKAVNNHDRLVAALKDQIFHFGRPRRDEWINDEAFNLASAASDRARALLKEIDQ